MNGESGFLVLVSAQESDVVRAEVKILGINLLHSLGHITSVKVSLLYKQSVEAA